MTDLQELVLEYTVAMTSICQKPPLAEVSTSATGTAMIWSMTSVLKTTAPTWRRVGIRISNPYASVRGSDVIGD